MSAGGVGGLATLVYAPGSRALVAVPGLAFLTPDVPAARRAWTVAASGGSAQDLLGELVRDGFGTLGAFVLVDTSGDRVRVLARGDVPAQVRTGADTVRVAGTGATTWMEHVFDGAQSIRVGDTDTVTDGFPLRAGMVRCAGFEYRAAVPGMPEPARSGGAPSPPPVVAEPEVVAEPAVESDVVAEPASDPAQTRTDGPDGGYDHLFESTIMRSVEDAAIREVADDPADLAGQPDSAESRMGDHDGHTITSAELDALRGQAVPPDVPTGQESPGAARLELSTGDVIALDRDVVIGRRPQVDRVQGGRVPAVVTVPSPQQDVSRTHLRIGWSGGRVLATDLHSMNGTALLGVDGTTRALDGGVAHPLTEGDTLDIGDGITVTLRLART
ncbi:MAG TPA: FHA domain-containing protein [Nakamurella sp.]